MSPTYPFGKGAVRWVSTEWLEENLDSELMVIDTQPNVHDYIFEHIPKAVYMHQGLFRVPKNGLPAVYVPEESIASILQRLGVRAELPTVIYTGTGAVKGWGDGLEQTMVAYSLVRFGHDNVYVLDGGLDKWKDEQRELTKAFPKIEESRFGVRIRSEYFIEYEEFKKVKDNPDVILLDARPANIYQGQGPWVKPGHIPGAINLPWVSMMNEKNTRLLKSEEQIREILQSLKIVPNKTVICSSFSSGILIFQMSESMKVLSQNGHPSRRIQL
jgi:thiosulfate/3-mercaptopyruvate sulfurtransferase